MSRDTLTGSRIRERRTIVGLRQSDLARHVGISASYLNLIEHNRRRIGGKLLVDIAAILNVEPSMLTEGAEAALIATLREAAADVGISIAETDRADEFAGRFPGWAEVLASGHRRIGSLERTVETLSDRLTHDPHLASSLHEVLSTAAAIRSTASILAETSELEPEWSDRFHKNLNEDSLRLAESSKELVRYLDENVSGEDSRGSPQEEVEAFVAGQGHHFPALEQGTSDPETVVRSADDLTSAAARQISRRVLTRYRADVLLMPLDQLHEALAATEPEQGGLDPLALARRFNVDLPTVFRRLAAMPEGTLPTEVGLVICDGSGSILYRKPIEGFALPRFGQSCPLWPLFMALSRPLTPIRRHVSQLGRSAVRFECYAAAHSVSIPAFDCDPLYQSTMLILPVSGAAQTDTNIDAQPVGSSCRICPHSSCGARREPSILTEGF